MISASSTTMFSKARAVARSSFLSVLGSLAKPKPGVHIFNGHVAALELRNRRTAFAQFLKVLQGESVLIDIERAVALRTASAHVDEPLVAFTFDDAFEDFQEVIGPVLESLSVRAAFFVNGGLIENKGHRGRADILRYGRNMLTIQQLEDLSQYHVIGSHGYGHIRYSRVNDDIFKDDVHKNESFLHKTLGVRPKWFAWPYGQLRDITEQQLMWLHNRYEAVFSSDRSRKHKMVINRSHVESFWPASHIRYFLS